MFGQMSPQLAQLLGIVSGQVPAQGTPPDANSNMSRSVMGFPSVFTGHNAPGAINETGALPKSQGNSLPAMQEDAVVSGWQPKHRTTLGTIADIFLMSQGAKPIFRNQVDKENMASAMSGFQKDPAEAIRRISKLNPTLGLKLQNEYEDNQRLQGNLTRQNKVFDLKLEDHVRDRIAGMLSVPGLAENPEAFRRMRQQAIKYGNDKGGIDLSDQIPESYDKLDIDSFRFGQIAPKSLMQMEDLRNYRDERTDQIDRAESGRNSRFSEGQAGQDRRTTTVQTRTDIRQQRAIAARPNKGSNDVSVINTKYGKGFVKGNEMQIIKGGNVHRYIRSGDKWVPHSVVPQK